MSRVSEKMSFSKMRSYFFLGLMGVLLLSLVYLMRPFFYPIFWAAVIAIMFYPTYLALNGIIKLPTISALLSLIIAVVSIFVPLSLILILLFHQSVSLYQSIIQGQWPLDFSGIADWLRDTPIAPYIQNLQGEWTVYATDATKTIALFVFNNISNITQNSLRFIFLLFITLYTLFFFFRDGKRMLQRLQHLSPLQNEHDNMLYERFTSTARATLKGTFIVGGVQGILGGLLFWITGIQGAFVWGVIMFLLSLIPGIGAFMVWLPFGVLMLVTGAVWQGVTILLVGALLISTIDNVLRPPLVGKDIQMHPLMVLFSTLGGIFLFGISGFIIGPIVASLCLAVISIYDHYYLHELKHNGN